jgi:hypothetical protein
MIIIFWEMIIIIVTAVETSNLTYFYLVCSVQTGSGVHVTPYSMDTGGCIPMDKVAGGLTFIPI